ncbi:hypothetical protein PF011_g8627 [Phytophthora fragariae]|uniref:SET domain-containing protein n=1 Tax=Phytophthora fragariae TaxID=53985 RepID=A0A6A3L2D2_9STRA|nr:hypothetical protein PF011_g8627 [Phytophthora fragariae]
MSDQEVIELLSSSDEASSSDSQSSRARRRSPSSSNDEEGKAQLKPSRRRLVRTSSVSSSGQRRKRHASSSSASSQEESDDSAEEHETVVQLKRPVKKPKVAATKNYVAPTPRPRADRRAAGEMRQITEGMSFYELQAQEQMMARFQNQNRRKAPATKPQAEHRSNLRETSTAPRQLKEKVSASELQAQERAIKQFHRQKARKSAPYAYTSESESGESEESEEKDDEWDRFTKVSTQREVVQKQKQNVATSRTSAVVNSHRETARKSAGSGSRTGDNRRASGKQQAARKMAVPKSQGQKTAKGALDRKPTKTRPGALPKKQSRDLLSQEESEEDSEEESEEPSEEESSEDEVELVAPPRQEKSSSNKKNVSKRSASASPSTTRQPKVSVPMVPPPTNAAQSSLRSVLHGVSETQHIAEKISFRELQAQEEALKFWRKRNSAGAPSTARKGEHSASTNGTRTAPKTNVSGRRARMGASQQETPATSSSLTCIAPPARNGFLAPSAQIVSAAGCTATPVKKLVDPVIHSTAWRRLVFEEAPPNILHAVSTTPFSTGFDKPLWEYDPKGELKKKCKFVAAAGQGVAITEENFASQSPSQSEVNTRVRELVEQELPPIKFFVASGTGVYSGRKLRIISHDKKYPCRKGTCGASDAAVMTFHPEFQCRSSYDLNICRNVNLLRGGNIQKKIGVAFSATHGWGAYALEPIRKDELVLEYTGELITDEEADRRGAIYDRLSVSYLFGVNSDYVVDAAKKGNKAKFANHKAKEVANLDVRIIASNGEDRIVLFAREAIEVGAELFFDYGYKHDTAPKWSQQDEPRSEKPVYVDDENDEWEQLE